MVGVITFCAAALTPAIAADSGEWTPPPPKIEGKYDWIELTSGEWLKGEFKSMYNESVQFDSDKLDLVTIDWSDIKAIHFAKPMGVRLNDQTVLREHVTMSDGKVDFPASDKSVNPKDVVSIVPVAHDEWDRWRLNGKIGFDFQRGNTDETRVTASMAATRLRASTRVKLSYIGNYTVTDGEESTNNHRANATFDYFFDERLYIRAFDGEYFRDPFQNIAAQITVGAGFGYKILDNKTTDWEILAGPAYQFTKFSTVEAGESRIAQSPAARFQTTFSYDITDDLDYNLNYNAVLTNKQSGLLTQTVITSLDYEITTIFDVFVMLQYDRVEKPTARSDGSIPDQNDVTLSFGLGVDI
ncbi:MAG: DUF481 domain-containing protein [Puniceicoccales bacterium]